MSSSLSPNHLIRCSSTDRRGERVGGAHGTERCKAETQKNRPGQLSRSSLPTSSRAKYSIERLIPTSSSIASVEVADAEFSRTEGGGRAGQRSDAVHLVREDRCQLPPVAQGAWQSLLKATDNPRPSSMTHGLGSACRTCSSAPARELLCLVQEDKHEPAGTPVP